MARSDGNGIAGISVMPDPRRSKRPLGHRSGPSRPSQANFGRESPTMRTGGRVIRPPDGAAHDPHGGAASDMGAVTDAIRNVLPST